MDSRETVRCYSCGRRMPVTAGQCARCGAIFTGLCECGAELSEYAETCPACRAARTPQAYRPGWTAPKLLGVLVLAAALGFLVYRFFPRDPFEVRHDAFVAAADDFGAGRFQAARLGFEEYLEDFGRDPRAVFMLGASLHRLGREEEGVRLAREAVELDPDLAQARMFLARVAYRKAEYAEALEHVEHVLGLPDEEQATAAHLLLGKIRVRPGYLDIGEAIHHLETGVRLAARDRESRDDPEAHVLLAELILLVTREGRLDSVEADAKLRLEKAQEVAGSALADRPDDPEIHFFLARCAYGLGNHDQARYRLQKAADFGTPTPEQRLLLARTHWALEDGARALRIVAEIEEAQPGAEVLLRIARFLQEIGERSLAERTLERAIDRFPESPAVVSRYAELLRRTGRSRAAEKELRQALARAPAEPRLTAMLAGILHSELGSTAEAEELLRSGRPGPASLPTLKLVEILLDTPPGDAAFRSRNREAAARIQAAVAAMGRAGPHGLYLRLLEGKLLLTQQLPFDAEEVLGEVAARSPTDSGVCRLLALTYRAQGLLDMERREWDNVIRIEGPSRPALLSRAQAFLDGGLPGQAARDCRSVLQSFPEDEAARILLARARIRQIPAGTEEAVRILREAVRAPGATARARIELGRALTARGSFEEAEKLLRDVVAETSDRADAWEAVGALADLLDARSGESLSPGSRALWEEHIRERPGSTPGVVAWAVRLLDRREFDDAREILRKALQSEPDSVAARRLLFEALCPDRDEAERHREELTALCRQMRELAPGRWEAFYIEGVLELLFGRRDRAVELLGLAAERSPLDSRVQYYYAVALLEEGRSPEAQEALSAALRAEPSLLSARSLLAQVTHEEGARRLEEGRLLDAAEEFGEALRLEPGHVPARALLSLALFRAGLSGDRGTLDQAHDECLDLIERLEKNREALSAEALSGVLAPAYLLLANIGQARDDWDGVIRACRGYLGVSTAENGPSAGLVRLRLAAACLAAGRPSEAVPELVSLLESGAPRGDVLDLLAAAKEAAGERDEAVRLLREWVDDDPRDPAARLALGRALLRAGDSPGAEVELRAATEISPDFLPAAEGLMRLLVGEDHHEEAVQALTGLLERTSRRRDLEYLISVAELSADPSDPRGCERLDRSVRGGIGSDRFRLEGTVILLRIRLRDNELEKAVEVAEDYARWEGGHLRLEPRSPLAPLGAEAYSLAGLVSHLHGRPERAEFHYQKALSLNPEDPQASNNLAEFCLERKGRAADALVYALQAVKAARESAEAQDTLGKAYLAQNDGREALKAFRESSRLYEERIRLKRKTWDLRATEPLLARARVGEAEAHVLLGDVRGAESALEAARTADDSVPRTERYRAVEARIHEQRKALEERK